MTDNRDFSVTVTVPARALKGNRTLKDHIFGVSQAGSRGRHLQGILQELSTSAGLVVQPLGGSRPSRDFSEISSSSVFKVRR